MDMPSDFMRNRVAEMTSLQDTTAVMNRQFPITHSPTVRCQQCSFAQFKLEFFLSSCGVEIPTNLLMKRPGVSPHTDINENCRCGMSKIPSDPVVLLMASWLAKKLANETRTIVHWKSCFPILSELLLFSPNNTPMNENNLHCRLPSSVRMDDTRNPL